MDYYNEQTLLSWKLKDLRRLIKASETLTEKMQRINKGEKVKYTMNEYDVLLDLRNCVSRMCE